MNLKKKEKTVLKYGIEQTIFEAANLSDNELQAIDQKSYGVLEQLETQLQWLQSYVADDKCYYIYVDLISKVKTVIDPTTVEP